MRAMIALFLAATATAGCQSGGNGPLGADFGEAVNGNAARQVIDPTPLNAGLGAPAMDGRRAAAAMHRYETGDVIDPEAVDTTDVIGTKRP